MRLQLNFAGGNYDFVRPLADGTVKPDGIDLNVLSGMGSGERHHRIRVGPVQSLQESCFVPRKGSKDRLFSPPAMSGCAASCRSITAFRIAKSPGSSSAMTR